MLELLELQLSVLLLLWLLCSVVTAAHTSLIVDFQELLDRCSNSGSSSDDSSRSLVFHDHLQLYPRESVDAIGGLYRAACRDDMNKLQECVIELLPLGQAAFPLVPSNGRPIIKGGIWLPNSYTSSSYSIVSSEQPIYHMLKSTGLRSAVPELPCALLQHFFRHANISEFSKDRGARRKANLQAPLSTGSPSGDYFIIPELHAMKDPLNYRGGPSKQSQRQLLALSDIEVREERALTARDNNLRMEPPLIDSRRLRDSRRLIDGPSPYPQMISSKPPPDMLIVLTTCNQLKMTLLALDYLRHSFDIADLVIVDDHSIDGTPAYLIKKGYFVISKGEPSGLTDSWNRGYELAVALGYKYVIFANNDILIPQGAAHEMRRVLMKEVLVVPLTTLKGAGHNPSQSLVHALGLREVFENYVDDPRRVQRIQDALLELMDAARRSAIKGKGKDKRRFTSSKPSTWRSKPRFNGFLFGVNITGIIPAAYSYPKVLFDPQGLMVGQEDRLTQAMTDRGLAPAIALGAFVYHFKSVTVSLAIKGARQQRRVREAGVLTDSSSTGTGIGTVSPPGRSSARRSLEAAAKKTVTSKPQLRPLTAPPLTAAMTPAVPQATPSPDPEPGPDPSHLRRLEMKKPKQTRAATVAAAVNKSAIKNPRPATATDTATDTATEAHKSVIVPDVPAAQKSSTIVPSTKGDIREDLRFYHPELTASSSSSGSGGSAGQLNGNKSSSKAGNGNEFGSVLSTVYADYGDTIALARRSTLSTGAQLSVYPPLLSSLATLQSVQRGRPVLVDAVAAAEDHGGDVSKGDDARSMGGGGGVGIVPADDRDSLISGVVARKIVIALATSDPVRNPAAGDFFTATELAAALTDLCIPPPSAAVSRQHANRRLDATTLIEAIQSTPSIATCPDTSVEVLFLHKGVDWYDAQKLSTVDVLITFLDDYDLAKALTVSAPSVTAVAQNKITTDINDAEGSSNQRGPYKTATSATTPRNQAASRSAMVHTVAVKPTIITIAWMRNWFPRWLSRPWIGSYDLILTSSLTAQAYFQSFQSSFTGLRVSCIRGCPSVTIPPLAFKFDLPPPPSPPPPPPATAAATAAAKRTKDTTTSLDAATAKMGTTGSSITSSTAGGSSSSSTGSSSKRNKRLTAATVQPNTIVAVTPVSRGRQPLISRRMDVPVESLRIATNPLRFYPDTEPASATTGTARQSDHYHHQQQQQQQQRARSLKLSADYAFTGSYFRVHREIMDLDPRQLPGYKGLIIGSGWRKANVSNDWRRMVVGALPYSAMPQVYRSVKIVIDDANHVTKPWGSINSRVFDALASGALVITNGAIGSGEVFGGRLPTYNTTDELVTVLKHYLTNEVARRALVEELRGLVLRYHTYANRAQSLSEILSKQFALYIGRSSGTIMPSERSLLRARHSSSISTRTKSSSRRLMSTPTTTTSSSPPAFTADASTSADVVQGGLENGPDDTLLRVSTNPFEERLHALLPDNLRCTQFPNSSNCTADETALDYDFIHEETAVTDEEEAEGGGEEVDEEVEWKKNITISEANIHGRRLVDVDSATVTTVPAAAASGNSGGGSGGDLLTQGSEGGGVSISNGVENQDAMVGHYIDPPISICIGIRTFEAQARQLEVLLLSFMAQHRTSNSAPALDLTIFIIDTERSSSRFLEAIVTLVQALNEDLVGRGPQLHVVWDSDAPVHQYSNNPFYGYDDTDDVLEFMTQQPRCEWIMFTNGDNIYNSAWFDAVAPLALDDTVDMIGWDFVSHHPRKDNQRQQTIKIEIKRKFVDLASVMARRDLFVKTGVKFLPNSLFTDDLFARDFYVISDLVESARLNSVRLLHRCLLFHQ